MSGTGTGKTLTGRDENPDIDRPHVRLNLDLFLIFVDW